MAESSKNGKEEGEIWSKTEQRLSKLRRSCAVIDAGEIRMVIENPRSYATVLVGQSSLYMEGLARIVGGTEFRVIGRASRVEDLAPGDIEPHEPVLLILDAGHDV